MVTLGAAAPMRAALCAHARARMRPPTCGRMSSMAGLRSQSPSSSTWVLAPAGGRICGRLRGRQRRGRGSGQRLLGSERSGAARRLRAALQRRAQHPPDAAPAAYVQLDLGLRAAEHLDHAQHHAALEAAGGGGVGWGRAGGVRREQWDKPATPHPPRPPRDTRRPSGSVAASSATAVRSAPRRRGWGAHSGADNGSNHFFFCSIWPRNATVSTSTRPLRPIARF
jgi:hypothetical protein